ncbi:MAG: S-methyl-5-thioribose kinase [Rhodobacter sp.]|nr:S-methyl-5-thioribose kinase [Rhodobacter sp.]
MDYTPLTSETLPARLCSLPALTDRIGPARSWTVAEVGDGNLNLVFIVSGPLGRIIVKQALPYVRLVGDSWPLPLNRAFFEYNALTRHAARDPGRVPEVFHFDEGQALIVMRCLSPHVILRKSVVQGVMHPMLARHMGVFLARSLFRGSALSLSGRALRQDMALFAGNHALADITENLVFSDPYFAAKLNRHTPGLAPFIAPLRADRALRIAAQEAKHAFLSKTETLVHGDLHSGSLMVTAGDTQVIDPEFAIYGPFGFDVGMFLANLLLAFHAQSGHEDSPGARDGFRDWLLGQLDEVWQVFTAEFRHLWQTERTGILYQPALFEDAGDAPGAGAALAGVLAGIWRDAMGFCGVEMHRRILGLAHVEDLEAIPDPARRLRAEARALELGRVIATTRPTPGDLGPLARDMDRSIAR